MVLQSKSNTAGRQRERKDYIQMEYDGILLEKEVNQWTWVPSCTCVVEDCRTMKELFRCNHQTVSNVETTSSCCTTQQTVPTISCGSSYNQRCIERKGIHWTHVDALHRPMKSSRGLHRAHGTIAYGATGMCSCFKSWPYLFGSALGICLFNTHGRCLTFMQLDWFDPTRIDQSNQTGFEMRVAMDSL